MLCERDTRAEANPYTKGCLLSEMYTAYSEIYMKIQLRKPTSVGEFREVMSRVHRSIRWCVMTLIVSGWSSFAAAAECRDFAGKLVSVEGDVSVADRPVRINAEICSGESIEVGNRSRAALRLAATQTVVRIDQNSTFLIEPSDTNQTWLKLLRGVIYLFSRQPESLRVDTPYINAAIDGTEFVVEASDGFGEVTVIEGDVLVSNALGKVNLKAGEQANASADQTPNRRVVIDPINAVQWALHYPQIGVSENTSEIVRLAADLLTRGDVERAQVLLSDAPEDAASKALEAIVAVTRNQLSEATRLEEQAVSLDAESSVAYSALSYTQQASFKIEQALDSAQIAVRNDPKNADALARLAELELGVDDTAASLVNARKAIAIAPDNSRAHTILGFARLVRLEIDEAEAAFTEAITRDPGDPLPRLGLGLAIIRKGHLVVGREHLEVAAALDPYNALVRSYLGKAYAEEQEPSNATGQFELAKQLDPQDPTPWLYDALLAQALNRPVEALRNIERARTLNDNRLVYQSRLLVDSDRAAGSLSLSRVYTDLGFHQSAINESARSIEADPTNFSAYRFLADSYLGRERHEAARQSVLFQASLLQPLTIDSVQPYAQESDLLILPGTDPVDPSIREYSPLFERQGFQLTGSIIGGRDNTFGDNLVLSGLHDRTAYSIGQFHYKTDGFRENADIEHDIYHGSVQGQLSPAMFIQADVNRLETNQGDFALNFNSDIVDTGKRTQKETNTAGIGLRAELNPRSTLLAAIRSIDRSETESLPDTPPFFQLASSEFEGQEAFGRLIHRATSITHNVGIDAHAFKLNVVDDVVPCPSEPCRIESGEHDIRYTNYYYYADFNSTGPLSTTLGLSYTVFDDEQLVLDTRDFNPKFGLRWKLPHFQELRLAASRGTKFREVADLGLEPTVLAGFNQLYDDFGGTSYVNVGVAYDWQLAPLKRIGVELVRRDLDVPYLFNPNPELPEIVRSQNESQQETMFRGYWNQIVRSDLSLTIDMLYERLERDDSRNAFGVPFDFQSPLLVETYSLPVGLVYTHRSGFFLRGEFSLVHQAIEQIDLVFTETGLETNLDEESEYFTNVNLSVGIRLPKRQATLRLDIHNLLDEDFLFEGSNIRSAEPSSPRYSPGLTAVAKVSFSYR